MKARVAVGVFLAFLPVLAHAQSTTTEQLLQALLPPNAVTPRVSAPISTAVTSNIATPSTSSATLSASAKATLLQSLYAELQTLEAEIAALEAAANHCTLVNLTRNLALGSSGTDVTQLQQFLVTQGDLTAAPTGYFGTLTQAAVEQFQKANNISPVGSIGPITRAKITALTNSCTTAGGGSSTSTTNPPTTPPSRPLPPLSTSTALGTPTTIINYTPPAGGGGGGGSSGGGSNPPPPPPPNYGSGIFAQFFQNGTLSIPSGSAPSAAPQVNVNSLLSYAIAAVNGNDSMLLPAGVIIQNSTNGSPIDVTTLSTQDIASSSVSGITTETPVGVLQWGTPSIPLSFTAPITLAIAVDPGFNGDTLDVFDSESQSGPWAQTGLVSPTCLITNGLCQFQTTSASFFAAAKRKATVTIAANPTTVSYGNSSTIMWSSTNATTCTASNGWSGSQALSGTQTFSNLTTNETYTLTCKNRASSATQSASVTVTGSAPDTTPPSAPTNLAGTATSPTQINLTWTASTDNVGVTGYNIYRAGTLIATSSQTSYSDQGLTASTQYTYTVKAFDAAGNISAVSNSINVTTQTPPLTTVTISANPTSVTSGNSSTLTWSSTNATSCTASGAWSGSKATSGSQVLTNLTTTGAYTLSCTGAGGSANQSATITVTILDTTPPTVTITAPATNLAAGTTQTTLAVTTNENATCAYSTNAAAAFASMTTFTTTGGTSHSTILSPLANGTSYTYYVKCKDTAGNISGNATVTFSVATPVDTTPPSVPMNLSATAVSSSAINLTWTASTDNVGVTGYKIFRGGVQVGTSATNSYSDSGLTASTQYTYTVSAYDAAGNNSAQSSSASATTQAGADTTPPSVPTNLAATEVSSSAINLTWTASTDNVGVTGYKIFRGGTQVGTSATNSYSDSGLTASTQYTYTVSAYDAAGNNSAQSTSASATTQAGSSGGGGNVTFVPVHTYYMSPTGNDANAGTSPSAPWATPNHSVVCGDVIIAAAGSYTVKQSWGTVSGCPSTSGGIDGTGGVYFATLLCGGSHVGACSIVGTGSTNSGGIDIDANNWAVEGWAVSQGYTKGGPSGFAFMVDTSKNTGVRHHIAFINNIAYDNASAFGTQNQGTNGGSGYGLDYWAIVGNITQNSAGRCDGYYDAAIDIIGTSNYDTNPGTHFFATQNFSYNNLQPVGCDGTDGESMMTDTLDALDTLGTVVIKNNILVGAARFGLQTFYQNLSNDPLTMKIYNNTLYGNNVGPANVVGSGCGYAQGGINQAVSAGTLPWIESIYNNIDQETVPNCLGTPTYPVYAAVLSGGPSVVVGGTGQQNVFYGLATKCNGTFCAGPYDAESFNSTNDLGVETYENPDFNNPTDFVNNLYGVPNCTGFTNTVACMGWDFSTQTATNPSVIYDMTPTAAGTAGKGYQPPAACQPDPDYPTWLKGIVYLQWNGSSITENAGLVTKPCESGSSTTPTATLSASPTSITNGQSSTLTWSSTNATSCTGTGFTATGTSGSTSVSPTTNTTYSITCTGSGGTSPSSSATIVVTTAQAPTASLSASPTSITSGSSSTLTWSSTNATSCTGTNFTASGTSGSTNVSPIVTTNYSITCTGAGGTSSPASATVTVTSGGDTTPPSVPTNLSATAISLSAINLTWTASTDNVGVTGYKIFRGGTQIGTSATNSYSDSGLTASTLYSYTVSAYDAAANNSAQSSSASATTQGSGSTLTNGLVGYWSFDTSDVSGTSITDLSGNSNTGTAAETPTLVTGQLNQALALTDGVQQINVGHGSSLNITGPFSVSFWLFPTTTPQAVDYVAFQKAQNYENAGFNAYYGYYSTKVTCDIGNGTSVASSVSMNLNQWNHIVCLYDGSHLQVYVNGTQTGSVSDTTNPNSSASYDMYLGSGGLDTGSHIFGDMDEFRVYNRALTGSEITQLYGQ
jgi:chitodextrinase